MVVLVRGLVPLRPPKRKRSWINCRMWVGLVGCPFSSMLTNRANDHVGRRGGLSLLLCIRMLLMLCDDVYVTMAIGDARCRWFEFNSQDKDFSLAPPYRFEGADDSGNPRYNLGFPDETFNMFVGCKNVFNTH